MEPLREAAKKNPFLVARPLRGEGKGLATKKELFLPILFILFPIVNKTYFILRKGFFIRRDIKNMALLVQKFCGGFFVSEFVSGYSKTKKKVPFSTKLEVGRGGKALVAKKNTFFAPSIIDAKKCILTFLCHFFLLFSLAFVLVWNKILHFEYYS